MKSRIEQQVMAGVAVVYAVRRLTSRLALECYALAASLAGIAVFSSLPHVAANFMAEERGGASALANFVFVALERADLPVQLLLLVGAAALALLFLDGLRRPSALPALTV